MNALCNRTLLGGFERGTQHDPHASEHRCTDGAEGMISRLDHIGPNRADAVADVRVHRAAGAQR